MPAPIILLHSSVYFVSGIWWHHLVNVDKVQWHRRYSQAHSTFKPCDLHLWPSGPKSVPEGASRPNLVTFNCFWLVLGKDVLYNNRRYRYNIMYAMHSVGMGNERVTSSDAKISNLDVDSQL